MEVATEFGTARVTEGRFAGAEVLHLSRHLEGHARLSHQVTHQANIAALRDRGAEARSWPYGLRCGRPDGPARFAVVFDDLHFLANRLADGSICTLHTEPGPSRAAGTGSSRTRSPRRCAPRCWRARPTRASKPATAAATATSTGRASTRRPRSARWRPAASRRSARRRGRRPCWPARPGIPFALLGYATDYANGVETRSRRRWRSSSASCGESPEAFARRSPPRCDGSPGGTLTPVGAHFRWD